MDRLFKKEGNPSAAVSQPPKAFALLTGGILCIWRHSCGYHEPRSLAQQCCEGRLEASVQELCGLW